MNTVFIDRGRCISSAGTGLPLDADDWFDYRLESNGFLTWRWVAAAEHRSGAEKG